MRVRFSSEARSYVLRETAYLRARSKAGALRFAAIVARARRQMETVPESGFTDSIVSLAGARRISVEEYLFDYDVANGVVTILVIRHARNTPTLPIVDEDEDFEAP